MARIIRELSFEEWVVHVFDHEGSGPEWYFDPDCDFWDGPAMGTELRDYARQARDCCIQ